MSHGCDHTSGTPTKSCLEGRRERARGYSCAAAVFGVLGLALPLWCDAPAVRAQTLPSSEYLSVSGTPLIASGGKLYFGTADRAYEYNPEAPSASGRGLTRPIAPPSTDWQAFLRANGSALLAVSGGTRDGRECYRGLRRYAPNVEELVFTTKECLLPDVFPIALTGSDDFNVLGDRLFYTWNDKLYVSDGTTAGSKEFDRLGVPYSRLLRVDSRLLYTDSIYRSLFYELSPTRDRAQYLGSWDANIEGTLLLLGTSVYGVGTNETSGRELWRWDLTANKSNIVADLQPGLAGSNPAELKELKGAIYLSADGPLGNELYRVDEKGMTLVRDIHKTGSAAPRSLTVVGDRLYFVADDGVHGEELWQSDGTEAGTRLVADLFEGKRGARVNGLAGLGGAAYFWADDGVWGESLWRARADTLEVVEPTTPSRSYYIPADGKFNDWPTRHGERAIQDPAGDVAPGNPIDLQRVRIAWTGKDLLVGYELAIPVAKLDVARMHLFFDVDRRADTGFKVDDGTHRPFGADYMIEGITLYRYRGATAVWDWEAFAYARWSDAASSSVAELVFDSAVVGTDIVGSKVIFWGSNKTQDEYASMGDP